MLEEILNEMRELPDVQPFLFPGEQQNSSRLLPDRYTTYGSSNDPRSPSTETIPEPRRIFIRRQSHFREFHTVQRREKHFDYSCQANAGPVHREAFAERGEIHEIGKGYQSIAG